MLLVTLQNLQFLVQALPKIINVQCLLLKQRLIFGHCACLHTVCTLSSESKPDIFKPDSSGISCLNQLGSLFIIYAYGQNYLWSGRKSSRQPRKKSRPEPRRSYDDKECIRSISPCGNMGYSYNCSLQDFVSDSDSFSPRPSFFNLSPRSSSASLLFSEAGRGAFCFNSFNALDILNFANNEA